jgi:3-dehydroquinate dehydratase
MEDPVVDRTPSDTREDRVPVVIVVVRGPASYAGPLAPIPDDGEVLLAELGAHVRTLRVHDERSMVEALAEPAEAFVLAPGVLEDYSGLVGDRVELMNVPVIVVHDIQEEEASQRGRYRRILPAAAASVSAPRELAIHTAIEGAAWAAWQRRSAPENPDVPLERFVARD